MKTTLISRFEITRTDRTVDELDAGVNIGGTKINNLRYADDSTLIAISEEDLRTIILSVKEYSENAGLYLNAEKDKTYVYC